MKLISIIMATYNREHFIVETLKSIQAQSYENFECLIIDDGGNDNTLEVITPILKADSRFTFLKRSENYKKGLPGSRNCGLDLIKGDYIIFFDDDDIVHPENLKICTETLDAINIDFCHYQKASFTSEKPVIEKCATSLKKELTKKDIEKIITQEIGLASCTVMWRRECFNHIRFNENLLYAEEWECYSRIISEGFKGVIIDSVLYYNRKHSNSNTGEFYNNNPARKKSKKEAAVLIIENLTKKQLVTDSLTRYFITLSLDYKEYNLFHEILKILNLPFSKKIKCQVYYRSYPLRI
ncbi:MAG: glycosyltransferase family 2 protein, partial [Flavobacterium sp.]